MDVIIPSIGNLILSSISGLEEESQSFMPPYCMLINITVWVIKNNDMLSFSSGLSVTWYEPPTEIIIIKQEVFTISGVNKRSVVGTMTDFTGIRMDPAPRHGRVKAASAEGNGGNAGRCHFYRRLIICGKSSWGLIWVYFKNIRIICILVGISGDSTLM